MRLLPLHEQAACKPAASSRTLAHAGCCRTQDNGPVCAERESAATSLAGPTSKQQTRPGNRIQQGVSCTAAMAMQAGSPDPAIALACAARRELLAGAAARGAGCHLLEHAQRRAHSLHHLACTLARAACARCGACRAGPTGVHVSAAANSRQLLVNQRQLPGSTCTHHVTLKQPAEAAASRGRQAARQAGRWPHICKQTPSQSQAGAKEGAQAGNRALTRLYTSAAASGTIFQPADLNLLAAHNRKLARGGERCMGHIPHHARRNRAATRCRHARQHTRYSGQASIRAKPSWRVGSHDGGRCHSSECMLEVRGMRFGQHHSLAAKHRLCEI